MRVGKGATTQPENQRHFESRGDGPFILVVSLSRQPVGVLSGAGKVSM